MPVLIALALLRQRRCRSRTVSYQPCRTLFPCAMASSMVRICDPLVFSTPRITHCAPVKPCCCAYCKRSRKQLQYMPEFLASRDALFTKRVKFALCWRMWSTAEAVMTAVSHSVVTSIRTQIEHQCIPKVKGTCHKSATLSLLCCMCEYMVKWQSNVELIIKLHCFSEPPLRSTCLTGSLAIVCR